MWMVGLMHVFLVPFQGTFVHFGGDILIRTEGTLSLGILKFETHPTIFNEEEQHTCLLESILGKTFFFLGGGSLHGKEKLFQG